VKEGEYIFENHCHPQYELIAVFAGSVTVVIEGGKRELKRGEIALIPPFYYHSIYTDGRGDYTRLTALFSDTFIPEEISADFKKRTLVQFVSSNSALVPVLDGMRYAFSESDVGKYGALIESYLIEAIYIHTYKTTEREEAKTHPRVKKITEYIDSRICEKIHLDDIAASLFISKSTLCHVFMSEMKISVKQYILQKKLSVAARLIADGMSASAAADAVGYENYANFYKMYKKIFGESPSGRG
jgi:AraC-like DNA-binding protein